MTKFGSIEFDDQILDALRDDSLVVFAGAGVSMGPPSNLPSFWKLACDIAQGSGKSPSMPLDRFLGELHLANVKVHERAAHFLSLPESAPNALHRDLLRLFRTVDRVRLVTTNFDTHFETAANELFDNVPDVFKAPALPLGNDFSGIVHVHGALPIAKHLVLTDADFGRAYLTEGWARRFLVDVFRKYTVLFVGYSHNDVVMNYLARALPPASVAGRFALTEEVGNWELLGIKPIRFVLGEDKDTFKELYDGVHRFADRMSRGVLDWQSSLAQLGGRIPTIDPEVISELEQALREVYTTRFLLDIARGPKWILWLNGRKYLDKLFVDVDLSERDQLLVDWMARHFVIQHPQVVVELVAAHGLRMNPGLWREIGRKLGASAEKQLGEDDLKCLVTVMLECAPANADRFVLMWLAERCATHGCLELALKAFMAMCQYRFDIQSGIASPEDEDNERRKLVAQCSFDPPQDR